MDQAFFGRLATKRLADSQQLPGRPPRRPLLVVSSGEVLLWTVPARKLVARNWTTASLSGLLLALMAPYVGRATRHLTSAG